MKSKQEGKLERYFKNSNRFLWGLGPGNQKKTYDWLRRKGFTFTQGSYTHVGDQLLQDPGIEKILSSIVVPCVKQQFPDEALDYLRDCWQAGTRPDMSLLKRHGLNDPTRAMPFLEINAQFHYVEGWGGFAGLWFEDIEELSTAWV